MTSSGPAKPPKFFSTFVFLDTESTGLPCRYRNPHITEISLIAVNRFSLEETEENKLPRVQNKLVLCFNPMVKITVVARTISGLNSNNLFHQKDFDVLAVEQIQSFLLRLDAPICILAQNGYGFDFPLINAEIHRVLGKKHRFLDCTGNEIDCSDTLHLFLQFPIELKFPKPLEDPNSFSSVIENLTLSPRSQDMSQSANEKQKKPGPYSLGEVYQRIFGEVHNGAHSAEGDCFAMMKLVHYLKNEAISWIESNYRAFSSISPMYQPRNEPKPLPVHQFPYQLANRSSCN